MFEKKLACSFACVVPWACVLLPVALLFSSFVELAAESPDHSIDLGAVLLGAIIFFAGFFYMAWRHEGAERARFEEVKA